MLMISTSVLTKMRCPVRGFLAFIFALQTIDLDPAHQVFRIRTTGRKINRLHMHADGCTDPTKSFKTNLRVQICP